MQFCVLLCLALLCPLVSAFLHHPRSQEKKKGGEQPLETTSTPKVPDFTFDLYRALAEAEPGKNIFFSPLSVSMSLGALVLGAGSSTKQQILEALGVDKQDGSEEQLHTDFQKLLQEFRQPRDNLQLSLGNGLFLDTKIPILDSFLSTLGTRYLADAFPTNFSDSVSATKQINEYVEKETKGQISELLRDLDQDTIMVLVNYIFFKAKWETRFEPQDTVERDFHVTPETVVQVPMMRRDDMYDFLLDKDLGCKVVGVPYQGGARALFILPNQGGMTPLESALSRQTLEKWNGMFKMRSVEVYLPKFSIKGSYKLDKVLPKLGITDVFTSWADLSGITNHSNLVLSEMVHKAVGEVDESGTKASAATGMVFLFKSARRSSIKMHLDRPFLMAIVYNSTEILFLGRVNRP